jgi:hypothetical protein
MVAYISNKVSSGSEAGDDLPVIVITGVASKAGKTSLAETLTHTLAQKIPVGAAKITVTHGERGCPHGGKGCDVCSSLGGDYRVIEKPFVINQKGTDTARLVAAGANPVLWTITREEFILDAWAEMRGKFNKVSCAIIESNTLAVVTRPAMVFMIADPTVSHRLWKPSAERLIATADFVVFNDRGTPEKRSMLLDELLKLRGNDNGIIKLEHPAKISERPEILSALSRIAVSNRF